jgi:hypothetical protein
VLRSRALRPALILTVVLALLGFGVTASTAATTASITVSTAIGRQDGSTATVEGYVVGQPTATNTVVRSNFPNDYALALADSASQTSTSSMLYVQITAAFRSSYGLQSNPGLLGQKITVTGKLSAYFSHAGLTSTTAFSGGGSSDPDPGDYYADAEGKTGAALKSALHTIISNQTKLSYDQVWNALKDTDQDPANTNNVIEIYSGRSLKSRARLGQVPWRLRYGDRPRHRHPPPPPRRRLGERGPRQPRLRQRRYGGLPVLRVHCRLRLLRAARGRPRRRRPDDLLHGRPLLR